MENETYNYQSALHSLPSKTTPTQIHRADSIRDCKKTKQKWG